MQGPGEYDDLCTKGDKTMKMNDNNIVLYHHCVLCLEEIKAKSFPVSPREYALLEVGWTKQGIQIWCKRHECNVMHIDFEGQKHPADTTRPKEKTH